MAIVQSVNGFGQATGRSVTRPYGYGRGLMSVDPAYAPYMSGRYAPVRVSYVGNTMRRAGNEVRTDDSDFQWGMSPEEREAWEQSGAVYTPSKAPMVPQPSHLETGVMGDIARGLGNALGSKRKGGAGRASVPYKPSGATLVPQPEAGGKAPKKSIAEIQSNIAQGLGGSLGRTVGTQPVSGVAGAAGTQLGRQLGRAGPKSQTSGLKNMPTGVVAKSPFVQGESWLVDAGQMESIRDIAVKQYVSENNEWVKGKGVPLVLGKDSYTTQKLPFSQIAAMVQVEGAPYTGPRVIPKDIPRGHPAWDTAARGELVQYTAYKPAFTVKDANNSYFDLGLWRPQNSGEIINWKRTFDALGMYAEGSLPNLNSQGWGYYENAAMAEFMKVANSNPKAAQSVADLPKVRESLLDYLAQQKKKAAQEAAAAGGGGGGQSYPFTQTNTTTSVQLSNMEDARETLRQQITNMIGRFPTDAEVKQFLGKLNDYERGHPSKSTTTTTYSDANTASTNVNTTSANIDEFAAAQEFAKANAGGDYHAYQQLRYYQAISDIIGSPMNTQAIPQAM